MPRPLPTRSSTRDGARGRGRLTLKHLRGSQAFGKHSPTGGWAALAALSAPNQVAVNHRLVGWGTLAGQGAWVPTLEALVALSPQVRFRLDHLRVSGAAFLWKCAWQGERDGGDFETPFLVVGAVDDSGLQRTMDVWEPEQLEEARARFEAVREA